MDNSSKLDQTNLLSFKDIAGNQTCQSINGGSLEIQFTVPLINPLFEHLTPYEEEECVHGTTFLPQALRYTKYHLLGLSAWARSLISLQDYCS